MVTSQVDEDMSDASLGSVSYERPEPLENKSTSQIASKKADEAV